MDAQLSFNLTITYVFAEVEHALVLSDVLYFLLKVAKLMQCDFKVVKEVCHRAVDEIELINVLLEDFGTL